MGNTVRINGPSAEVRWHYQRAASLGPWTLTGDATGCRVTAKVLDANTFRVQQHPLTFVVPRQHGLWTWPVISLQIADGSLTAVLNPQE